MRLCALRVADVGRFNRPVALEDFGPGLNVLSGPNEFGKSTLLEALRAVFLVPYKSTAEAVRALKPNAGGAPLIEAEFEADGVRWCVRKQFNSGAAASLTNLATGAALRNPEVQPRLDQLIRQSDTLDKFSMMWVKQSDALETVKLSVMGSGLAGLIEGEIQTIALDARARAVHDAIRKSLDVFKSGTGRAKKKSPLADALAAHAAALANFEMADRRRADQSARLDELAGIHIRRATLLDPAAVAARTEALATSRAAAAKARDDVQHQRMAAETLKTEEAHLAAATQDERTLATAIADHAALTRDAADAQRALDALAARAGAMTETLTTAQAAIIASDAALATLDGDLATASAAAEAAAAAIDREKLAAQISDARAADTAAARARATAAALADVTEPRVKALRVALGRRAEMEAALAAVVPEVAIDLLPAAAGRIRIAGTALAASTTLHPDAPLVLEIDGIGRITIAPNPATASPAMRAVREAARAETETALSHLGAVDLTDAEARLAARQQADADASVNTARLKALAPQGLDALVTRHADLAHRASLAPAGGASLADLTAARVAAVKTHADATAGLKAADRAIADVGALRARHEGAATERNTRLAALTKDLDDEPARAARLAATRDRLATAQAAFMAAKRAADAWTAAAEAQSPAALTAVVAAAEQAMAMAETSRVAFDNDVTRLESALSVAGDEDIAAEHERATAAVADAARVRADLEAEVAALDLLDRSFSTIAETGRDEFATPIRSRIAPYLHTLFPDAVLALGDGLSPSRLDRAGTSEPHSQLSLGTREQIGILVRLGLARLLADRGEAVPLILDDAPAFADDERVARLFTALQAAAAHSQVLVFNCRARTFDALATAPGAKALALSPWPLVR